MTKTVHHAIRALAARNGTTIVEAIGGFRLVLDATQALSVDTFASAGEISETLRRKGGFEEITWEDLGKARKPQASGVMAISYHKRYSTNPHGPGSNDGLDVALRDAFTKPEGVDVEALQALGEALGLWNASWSSLNPGMRRMNLSNRIRAYLRNNADASVTIGEATGRFGVEVRTPAVKQKKGKAVKA